VSALIADEAFHARLQAAVAAAEKKTDGEVVVALTRAADDGRDAAHRAAAVAAVLVLGLIVFMPRGVPHGVVLLVVAFAYLATFATVSRSELLARVLTSRARRVRAAREAARVAFFEHRVAATKDRLGVLVHAALREGLVHVIADTGAEERVPPATWHAIEHRARSRGMEEALLAAIDEVGTALAAAAPPSGDHRSELDDAPRIES
jgi:putative membrane protein